MLSSRLSIQPVPLDEAQIIPWSTSFVIRALAGGIDLSGRRKTRREVARVFLKAYRGWFQWTAALPGDVFFDLQRDLYVQVVSGVRRRRVRLMPAEALHFQTVRHAGGLDSLWRLTPIEDSPYRWLDLSRVTYV